MRRSVVDRKTRETHVTMKLDIDGRGASYGANATAVGRVVLPDRNNAPVAFDLRGPGQKLVAREHVVE